LKRPWLVPLVPLYAAGLGVKNALAYRRPGRLGRPVVSVGSLSAGGAGKTPVVLALARLLEAHGVAVDVLSRGYGRTSSVTEVVDPAGAAARFGDEPLELARQGLRVFVGADRLAAGRVAEVAGGAGVHLLDDGFQHRRLGRELDVVLLTVQDAGDWLLPAGDLREPLSALGRADVVVVREEEAAALAAVIARHTQAETWVIRRELSLPAEMAARPMAFCGIARPEGFLAMLQAVGCEALAGPRFADHHAYSDGDVERLVEAARAAGADGFVTTAKDAVKLSAAQSARLGAVAVAELRVRWVDEARVWGRLQGLFESGA
jgi:tetraacyldisaccharide 4'-kinase